MPTLFLGHGSPMNAVENNDFTKMLNRLGETLPRPEAILCISAHWLSAGTWATHMRHPRTIHDFYGFPQKLFDVEYSAQGSPELAERIQTMISKPKVQLDESSWGFDHGTWSVLKHLYPQADLPVVQLSLDMSEPARFHYELGQKLKPLREEGILILGSGNIVHNLSRVDWKSPYSAYDWAVAFDHQVKAAIEVRDVNAITQSLLQTSEGRLSVPTPDHYLPLLYPFGAADDGESVTYPYEGYEMGALSMRCVQFGN